MRGGDHVGTRRVHRRVDGERRGVHDALTLDDLAPVVDADEIGGSDVTEAHPEGVDPEVVEVLGIACGDVAGDPFFEAELAEDPEPRREPLLAVQPFLLDGFEVRQVPAVVEHVGQFGHVEPL